MRSPFRIRDRSTLSRGRFSKLQQDNEWVAAPQHFTLEEDDEDGASQTFYEGGEELYDASANDSGSSRNNRHPQLGSTARRKGGFSRLSTSADDEDSDYDQTEEEQQPNSASNPFVEPDFPSETEETDQSLSAKLALDRLSFDESAGNGWPCCRDRASDSKAVSYHREIVEQLWIIVKLGLPNNVEKFSSFLPPFLMLMFMGKLGPDEIAGAGMGFMFGNVSGISMIVGFGLGLPPLASQAFGARNYQRVSELLQRQLLMHLLLVVPLVALIWCNAEAILVTARQPAAIAALTQEFLWWRLPALPFLAVAETLTNYIKAQRVMVPSMVLMVIVNAISVPLAYALMYPMQLGFKGGPIALTVANMVQALCLVWFAKDWLPHKMAWPAWPWKLSTALSLSGWSELLSLSVPGAVMLWAEWWAWEMNLFLAGLLCTTAAPDSHDDGYEDEESPPYSASGAATNTSAFSLFNLTANKNISSESSSSVSSSSSSATCVELDVFPIVSNTMVLAFFIHFGYSFGASTHVGNLLGAGKPHEARLAALVCFCLVGMTSGSVAVMLLVLRHQWGGLFSSEIEVQESVSAVLPLVAGYIALDALGPGALNNILRAVNSVRLPALLNVSAFYVVGIPLGLILTFAEAGPHWGIYGLWSGLLAGMVFMVFGLAFVFVRLDWVAVAASARQQALKQDSDHPTEPSSSSSGPKDLRSVGGVEGYDPVVGDENEDDVEMTGV